MLDTQTKRRIDSARDILVGKVPDPKSQVEQITIALIYKFMDDMDAAAEEEFGVERTFFAGEFAKYGWAKLMSLGGDKTIALYSEAIDRMPENPGIPQLFRDIFKNAYLPYKDPETLRSFLKIIGEFHYDHSEKLGDAFEYLLSVLGSQGDAGQFRTPRHIIDFIVEVIDPKKDETILDPACGTAGFLISAYKHILRSNSEENGLTKLTPDEKGRLGQNLLGYDISPDMVRLSLVNLYLHGFASPKIEEYDTLTSEDNWKQEADVILANPPFMSPKGGIKPHTRFKVKSNRSEVLFVDYIAEHLTTKGRAGIIVPEGVIFQSGTAYKALRKMLVENFLVAVVSLPAGIFNPYSGVKTSILIFDKALAKQSETVGFFKIENDGFGLGAQRRAIDKNDLPTVKAEIGEYLRCLRAGESLDDFAPTLGHIVLKEKIAVNGDYNLSGERHRDNGISDSLKWPLVPLGKLCNIERGASPRPIQDFITNSSDGVNWIKIGDAKIGSKFVVETKEKITIEGANKSRRVKAGDFILSNSMSFGRPYIMAIDGCIHDGWLLLREDVSKLDKNFLYYILSSDFVLRQFQRAATGGVVNNLNSNLVRDVVIPLPSLEVQKEIAAEIEEYQKVIDGARAVLENYQPHIPINPEWAMFTLGDICSVGGTITTDVDLSLPYFGADSIESNTGKLLQTKSAESQRVNGPVYRFDGERLLYSKIRPYLNKLTIINLRGYCSSDMYPLLPDKSKVEINYLATYMLSDAFNEHIRGYYERASIPKINRSQLFGVEIPLPPLAAQQQIVDELQVEQRLVEGNRILIELFEKKIQTTIARVWGEDKTEKPVEIKGSTAPLLLIEPEYSEEQWQDAVTYYLTYHLRKDPHFMRTKRHKMTYIAETAYQLPLGGEYHREAAGPLDINMLTPLEERMAAKNWIHTKEWEANGKHGVHYSLGSESKKALAESRSILGEKTADLDRLIEIFKKFNTKTSEKIATLFAAWNDFLIQGKSPSDDEILDEVWNNWNDSKKKIPRQEWSETLNWMKQNNFIPIGKGPRTKRKVALVRGK